MTAVCRVAGSGRLLLCKFAWASHCTCSATTVSSTGFHLSITALHDNVRGKANPSSALAAPSQPLLMLCADVGTVHGFLPASWIQGRFLRPLAAYCDGFEEGALSSAALSLWPARTYSSEMTKESCHSFHNGVLQGYLRPKC